MQLHLGSLGGLLLVADICPGNYSAVIEDDHLGATTRMLWTRHLQERGEEERPNQRCWLCEERRTCIRRPGGWECRDCRQIQ